MTFLQFFGYYVASAFTFELIATAIRYIIFKRQQKKLEVLILDAAQVQALTAGQGEEETWN